jgi:DNA-binding transcriptional LysR family regulator
MKRAIRWESRIGRRLRLRDLHVLSTVAQSGSMAKAAVVLGVSQPVISDAMAHLEATIGVRLLDRSRRGVTPTIYGRALLERSQIAFDELRQGVRDIEFLADPTMGEVRIGCSESLASGMLAPIVDDVARRFPRVRFTVTVLNTLNPRLEFLDLRERKLDAVLARAAESFPGEYKYAEDLAIEKLFDDHLVVVAGASSPWAARRKINLAELADVHWILPVNSWNGWCVEEAFRAIGAKAPGVTVDTFSVALRRELLVTGRYVAAIPASTLHLKVHDDALKTLPVAFPKKPWPVVMVTLKDRTLSSAAQHFLECARVAARAMTLGPTRKRAT